MSTSEKVESRTFTPVTSFPLRLSLPQIYPDTEREPFIFHMRVQLVADAEELQREFLMKPDTDRKGESFHEYDAAMLATLSTKPPEGFPDFPEVNGSKLSEVMKEYLFPEDPERREGMKFICRRAMAMYWRAVQPDQYL